MVDKIINDIHVIKDINNDYKYDIESILYAFVNKFLNGKDLERVKEEVRMTELGWGVVASSGIFPHEYLRMNVLIKIAK
jgi:hypothetical protein